LGRRSRTFRIFVSSTFADLKAERDALHADVFPALRSLCEAADCRFQAVDLRWGVSGEAGLDQQAMRICLDEVNRCQKLSPKPNFIVLLGDRYGWRPLPGEIPEAEFRIFERELTGTDAVALLRDWYRRDENAVTPIYWLARRGGRFEDYDTWDKEVERPLHRALAGVAAAHVAPDRRWIYLASATEQEILHGALTVADAPEHVFGFFRDLRTRDGAPLVDDLPEDGRADRYVDTYKDDADRRQIDRGAWESVQRLKRELKSKLDPEDKEEDSPQNAFEYTATWEETRPSDTHIEALKRDVLASLSAVIAAQIRELESESALKREVDAHADFGAARAKGFVGRSREVAELIAYSAGGRDTPRAVCGESGSGKSALLARLAGEAKADRRVVLIERYIGATPQSTELSLLLRSLCEQIDEAFTHQAALPHDVRELIPELANRLKLATPERSPAAGHRCGGSTEPGG